MLEESEYEYYDEEVESHISEEEFKSAQSGFIADDIDLESLLGSPRGMIDSCTSAPYKFTKIVNFKCDRTALDFHRENANQRNEIVLKKDNVDENKNL
jgi:hypothetical protein